MEDGEELRRYRLEKEVESRIRDIVDQYFPKATELGRRNAAYIAAGAIFGELPMPKAT